MPYNSVAYIREAGGPGELEKHVADIQGSGLTTVILSGLHMGWPEEYPAQKFGDFIYNNYPDNLIVRGGKFNPNGTDAIKRWPAQVAKLKQQGSVSSVFLSVAGVLPWWADFANIQKMFAEGKAGMLKQNIVALREAFTIYGVCAIDGIDIDCEEDVSQDTIVRFCEMVFDLGFKVTFCPYINVSWWQDCMQTLWQKPDKDYKVSWWNLQCYSGGSGNLNNLQPWIDALGAVVGTEAASSYLVPGLAPAGENDVDGDYHCPFGSNSFETIAAGWKNPTLGGVFLWRYDPLPENPQLCGNQNNLANYVKAINQGLSKG
jgi:hypothetical protein